MIKILEKTIDIRANYALAHVVRAVLLIGETNTGRERLMEKLGMNEAPARTLLNNLERNKVVKPTTRGHILTKRGRKLLAYLKKNISGPKKIETGLTLSKYNIAYLARGKAIKIRHGLEQRDQAILMGADGLTTLIYNERLRMAGVKWKVPKELNNVFDYRKGDVLLIGSAKDERTAEFAALNASIQLLR
ncbi:MAG: hypothetical protein HYT72_00855 [Candidatus Aenigmarchaeota archaeon]|nr:hypothetical protein [Candidatus Aenigmarchaeota archaeon]